MVKKTAKPGRFKSRTRWREKLERPQSPKLVEIPERLQDRYGDGKMLIPRPLDVDALVRLIPRGRLLTLSELRGRLARDQRADVTCPLTTGIFLRIAAEAAEEDRRGGKPESEITPYWRVIRDDGSLIDRFPGGVKAQAQKLLAEGHTIKGAQGRRMPKVAYSDWHLIKL